MRRRTEQLMVAVAIAVAACDSKKTVTTPQGALTVPGDARIVGKPGGVGFVPVEIAVGHCESPALAATVRLESSRKRGDRTELLVADVPGCHRGWVDERWIVPLGAP
jgi:hypothetical protein